MSDIFTLVLSIGTVFYIIFQNRHILKKLKTRQILGISISFLFTIAIATILIYGGGNWIVKQLSAEWLRTLIFYLIIIAVIGGAIFSLNKIVRKITNGAFYQE
ncbi:hypothetical protein [Virgibacillus ainsalahensis]